MKRSSSFYGSKKTKPSLNTNNDNPARISISSKSKKSPILSSEQRIEYLKKYQQIIQTIPNI